MSLTERIVLPRLEDTVEDSRHLLGFTGTWFVVIPIQPSEQQFMCAMVGARHLVFEVLGMGGRSSPNIWGRLAAAIGRVVSSVFNGDEFRCEIHVGDPLLAAGGSPGERSRIFTVALLAIAVLGFSLSWDKACLGDRVVWVGAQLSIENSGVSVAIPEDELEAFRRQTAQFLSTNVARKKDLRSFCGKLSFVAGMVPPRCGLSLTWFGRHWPHTPGCRWISFTVGPSAWLFGGWTFGPMVFPVTASWAPEEDHFATDACPWGFAGVLFESIKPVAWYATPLTKNDLRKFRVRIGESKHNTTWEALALLVAVRLWLRGTRVLARVKADSLSALRSVVQLTSKSADFDLIARELVLDAALGLYTVGLATHIPAFPTGHRMSCHGCGLLSRTRCRSLFSACQHRSPVRDRWFWKTAVLKHRSGALARRLTPPGYQGTTCYGPGPRGWGSARSRVMRVVAVTRFRTGTRVCIVRPCGRVRLRHFPRDLHRRSPPVAPTLPRTTLWYQPAPTVPLWLLIVEGADGRRLFLPAICVHSARPSENSKVESKRSRTKSHMPRKLQSWTDVAKATGHPDLWSLDPRILYNTSAALWKAGCRSLYQYLSAVAGIHPQPRVAAQCL